MTSWNNLDMKCDEDSLHPSTSQPNMTIPHKETLICQLNDDCLLHIFNYLKFPDQFNLARSCEQFQNAFVLCVRSKYKVFCTECLEFQYLSTYERRELFALVGRHIEAIQIDSGGSDYTIFELTGEFCPNLSIVDLTYYSPMFNINKLVDNLPMITNLRMYSTGNCIKTKDIVVLKKLALKNLTLNSAHITGRHLNQLKTLQYLDLGNCIKLIPKYLIEMLKALVDLHALCFNNCKKITIGVCHALLEHSKKLEYLNITLLEGFEIIAQLPSLKRLEMSFDEFHDITHMLEELVDKAMQLEYLGIQTVQWGISPNISLILSSLKNLKALKFDILLNNINDEWFHHFSKLENLEHIEFCCGEITIDYGFLQMMANCKRLSYVQMHCILYPSIAFETTLQKAIAILRSSKEERVLPVLFNINRLKSMHDEYKKAITDGIISFLDVTKIGL